MPSTARTLRRMATVINTDGLHRGEQFAAHGATDRFDLSALAFIVAEDHPAPAEFFTDELAAMRLIECSAGAMQTIRALSDALPSMPPLETLPNGVKVPNYIDHVSNWASTTGIGQQKPPTETEVVGRLIRTAEALEQGLDHVPHQRAA